MCGIYSVSIFLMFGIIGLLAAAFYFILFLHSIVCHMSVCVTWSHKAFLQETTLFQSSYDPLSRIIFSNSGVWDHSNQ